MSPQKIIATVDNMTFLFDTLLQLYLIPEPYVEYQAGHYLQILLENEVLNYSIANAPLGLEHYELHIRYNQENQAHQHLLAMIKQRRLLTLCVPLGDCGWLQFDPAKPLLFIAAGTGFAPIKAMIEQVVSEGSSRPFELYWCARFKKDLYMDKMLHEWKRHMPLFKYVPYLSLEHAESVSRLVLEHHAHDLNAWQIILSGSFDWVYKIRDELIEAGATRAQLFSDAFSFEGAN